MLYRFERKLVNQVQTRTSNSWKNQTNACVEVEVEVAVIMLQNIFELHLYMHENPIM